ncbi:MAG: hypothetical protein DRN30_02485 [Thermoplasmata archaeon]|nr:MFS transporter [Euryarchaeota archaeon]RLF66236.1 MAG: hypothetical protein DRN30_02485 [Thermoplasmata archaeon]
MQYASSSTNDLDSILQPLYGGSTMHSKLPVIMLLMVSFLGTAAFRISVPAVAFYTRQVLEASALGVGLLTSSFFAGRALFAVVAGGLADKYRDKIAYMAAICFSLNAVVVYLYGLVNDIVSVILIRALQGALNGIAWVSVQVILGSSVSYSIRGRVYAIYFALGTLGNVAANKLYSSLSNKPLSSILVISSILFLATAILILVIGILLPASLYSIKHKSGKESNVSEENEHIKASIVIAIPVILIVLGVSMFSSIVRGDLVYIYMNEAFKLSRGDTADIIAFASLIALVGGYILSWISDKVNDTLALRIAISIGFLGSILVSIRALIGVITGLVLYYIANSAIISISRRIAITHYKLGGTVMGLINAAGNIGSVTGSSIAGLIYDIYGLFTLNILGVTFTGFISIMSLTMVVSLVSSFVFLKK